jgi:hypothetical protein
VRLARVRFDHRHAVKVGGCSWGCVQRSGTDVALLLRPRYALSSGPNGSIGDRARENQGARIGGGGEQEKLLDIALMEHAVRQEKIHKVSDGGVFMRRRTLERLSHGLAQLNVVTTRKNTWEAGLDLVAGVEPDPLDGLE